MSHKGRVHLQGERIRGSENHSGSDGCDLLKMERVRSETRAEHRTAEAGLPLMRLGLGRNEYVFWLEQLHGIVTSWEEGTAGHKPGAWQSDWLQTLLKARSRRALLERDLGYFGVLRHDGGRATLPAMNGTAGVLGAMYVMEGSTLGGQLIGRHVEKVLGLKSGVGNSFFLGYGDRTGGLWREFCAAVETRVPESDGDAVVAAAKGMFGMFGGWLDNRTPIRTPIRAA